MVGAGCASVNCAPAPRSSATCHRWLVTQHRHFLIGCAAIKNPRSPLKQHAMFFLIGSKVRVCKPVSRCLHRSFLFTSRHS